MMSLHVHILSYLIQSIKYSFSELVNSLWDEIISHKPKNENDNL